MDDYLTYYEILEIPESASKEEIKRAFRKLSKEYHPDRVPDHLSKLKQDAEAKFKQLNEAYQTLSSPLKRKQYDELLKDLRNSRSRGATNENTSYTSASPGTPELELSQTHFDFSNIEVGSTVSGSFIALNVADGILMGSISSSVPWIKAPASIAPAMKNQSQTIQFTINTANMNSGFTGNGTISIKTNGGNRVVSVSLSMESAPNPKLGISPMRFDFSNIQVGQSVSGSFTVINLGGGILTGSISSNVPWITLPTSIAPTKKDQNQTIQFTINTANVNHGFSGKGMISIKTNAGDDDVYVFLTVRSHKIIRKIIIAGASLFFGIYLLSLVSQSCNIGNPPKQPPQRYEGNAETKKWQFFSGGHWKTYEGSTPPWAGKNLETHNVKLPNGQEHADLPRVIGGDYLEIDVKNDQSVPLSYMFRGAAGGIGNGIDSKHFFMYITGEPNQEQEMYVLRDTRFNGDVEIKITIYRNVTIINPSSQIKINRAVIAENIDSNNNPVGINTSFYANARYDNNSRTYVIFYVEYEGAIVNKTEFSVKWLKDGQEAGLRDPCRKTLPASSGSYLCQSGGYYLQAGNYEAILIADGQEIKRTSFSVLPSSNVSKNEYTPLALPPTEQGPSRYDQKPAKVKQITGEIVRKDDRTITIQSVRTGSSVTIFCTYNELADLKNGDRVTIKYAELDGRNTAKRIAIKLPIEVRRTELVPQRQETSQPSQTHDDTISPRKSFEPPSSTLRSD